MDYEKLGKNIRKYRIMRGLKQEELAAAAGCSSSHIGQIENARGIPSLEMVVKIANVLQVTPDQLLLDSSDVSETIYMKEIEDRLKKLPTSTKIMACDAIADLLDIVERLHK